ncbi:MAG: glycosyltransferase family 2 protein [Alistipes sp.]
MTTLAILFWIGVFLVCYTYLGYGLLLAVLVKIRERISPVTPSPEPPEMPEVTLLIAAYNEQAIVAEKMVNCRDLDYAAGRLHLAWVTDGSTDRTCELLAAYNEVTVLHDARRGGKTAALNRALEFIHTPIVIFTDANTLLNKGAVREIVRCFNDPRVGCVAGEKRVATSDKTGASATEGVYWRYESKLKELDGRLHTTVGAAGELFAVRRELWEQLPEDTLLDDFVCSMRIAARGYKIAYCKAAYAEESPSADMGEEGKRKQRIAAGGLQSVWRLRALLNPFGDFVLWFQYLSHRVLRWTLTPLVLLALLPLNILLLGSAHPTLYTITLILQVLFYGAAFVGYLLECRGRRNRLLFIPYYFLFMNLNVFRGVGYLITHRGRGAWEKARRA